MKAGSGSGRGFNLRNVPPPPLGNGERKRALVARHNLSAQKEQKHLGNYLFLFCPIAGRKGTGWLRGAGKAR